MLEFKKKYDIGDVFKEEVNEARSKEDELEVAKAIAAWKKAGGKIKKLPPGRKFQSLFGKGYKPKKQPRQAEEVETEASTYRDKKYAKKKTGKVPPSQKEIRWGRGGYGKEEVEVDEADVMRYRRGKAEKSVDDKFKKKQKPILDMNCITKIFHLQCNTHTHTQKKKGFTVDPKRDRQQS